MEKQNNLVDAADARDKAETDAPADARKPYHAPELIFQGQLDRITAGSGNTAPSPICYIP